MYTCDCLHASEAACLSVRKQVADYELYVGQLVAQKHGTARVVGHNSFLNSNPFCKGRSNDCYVPPLTARH